MMDSISCANISITSQLFDELDCCLLFFTRKVNKNKVFVDTARVADKVPLIVAITRVKRALVSIFGHFVIDPITSADCKPLPVSVRET